MNKQNKETEDLTVLPLIEYEYTVETAKALVASSPSVPEHDPSLGKKDPINSQIIKQSKFWNKVESTREKVRKEQKEPSLAYGREVDARSKELHEIFEPMKLQYGVARKAIDVWEAEQEQKRIREEELRTRTIDKEITKLREIPLTIMGKSAKEIEAIYDHSPVPSIEIFQERHEEAIIVYKDSMTKLEDQILTMRKSEQADIIIAEEKKKADEAKARVDAEIRKDRENFEKEKAELKKEREALDAEKNAQKEKENRERVEQELKEMAESERIAEEANREKRIAKEQGEKEEQEDKLAKKKCEAMDMIEKLMGNMCEDCDEHTPSHIAEIIIEEIYRENVPHVKWEV